MELYKEILSHALSYGEVKVTFPCEDISVVTEGICYQALQKIKAIVQDQRLDDKECFDRIEEIVCVLESIGSGGGWRHDFG